MCAEDELSVGELADILEDSQPQISRRAAPLRQLGLLVVRKEATRSYLRLSTEAREDPVVEQAVLEGRRLARSSGCFARLTRVVAAREDPSTAFFASSDSTPPEATFDAEPSLAHLSALSSLLPAHRLAVDVGCGDGPLLELLDPLFARVIGVDRSPAQLARAAERVRRRRLAHVRLHRGGFDDVGLVAEIDAQGGADLVIASRVLHHASRPAEAVRSIARLLAFGGHLIVVDYLPHSDERMREQGDIWLGLSPRELAQIVVDAGLEIAVQGEIPDAYHPSGPDAHLSWQFVTAKSTRGPSEKNHARRTAIEPKG